MVRRRARARRRSAACRSTRSASATSTANTAIRAAPGCAAARSAPRGAVLVRPDRFVAWRSLGAVADPAAALGARARADPRRAAIDVTRAAASTSTSTSCRRRYAAGCARRACTTRAGASCPTWSAEEALARDGRSTTSRRRSSRCRRPACASIRASAATPRRARWRARVNEFAAQVARDHPGRFGFFATLTLPDVDGALAEARVRLRRARRRGRDPAREHARPLSRRAGRRAALRRARSAPRRRVRAPRRCCPGPPVAGRPALRRRLPARHHARGVPAGAERRRAPPPEPEDHPLARRRLPALREPSPDGRAARRGRALSRRRCSKTCAASTSTRRSRARPAALPSLLAFAKPGHVLFGSDWPFAPAPAVAYFTGQLDAYAALDAAGHAAIDRTNASALFPRF